MTRRILKSLSSPKVGARSPSSFPPPRFASPSGEQGDHSICKISQAAEAKRRPEKREWTSLRKITRGISGAEPSYSFLFDFFRESELYRRFWMIFAFEKKSLLRCLHSAKIFFQRHIVGGTFRTYVSKTYMKKKYIYIYYKFVWQEHI